MLRILVVTVLIVFIGHFAFAAKPPPPPTVTLVKNSNMSFGFLDYATTHSGSLRLGTNGIMTIVGGVGISSDNNTTAGSVTVTAPTSGIIEVKCTTSGILKLGNSGLDLINPEINVNVGVTFGSGNACQGNKGNSPPAAVIDLAVNPNPNILIGGRIDIPANGLVSGTYSTAVGGGAKTLTLTVVLQ